MRIARKSLYLSLVLLTAFTFAACDQAEQNYDIEPGENLSISGPSEVTVPDSDTAAVETFNIFPFTIDKNYEWAIEGEGATIVEERRSGEYIDVEFTQPGTYTLTIDDGEYTGSKEIVVSYPAVDAKGERMGLTRFNEALAAAGLTDALSEDGPYTIFAPNDEAFVSALDTSDNGGLNLPADTVLADILRYHVTSGSVMASDITDGQEVETLEGGHLTFDVQGDDIYVEDEVSITNPALITNTDADYDTGLIHTIDALRLPDRALVAFNAQSTSGDTVGVSSVYLPEGGFVAIHETEDDGTAGRVIGVSEKLEPGLHNSVTVELFEETQVPGATYSQDELQEDQTLIAMPHVDNPDDGIYEFVLSGGSADGPYLERDGETPVTDSGAVTVED